MNKNPFSFIVDFLLGEQKLNLANKILSANLSQEEIALAVAKMKADKGKKTENNELANDIDKLFNAYKEGTIDATKLDIGLKEIDAKIAQTDYSEKEKNALYAKSGLVSLLTKFVK